MYLIVYVCKYERVCVCDNKNLLCSFDSLKGINILAGKNIKRKKPGNHENAKI